MFLIASGLSFTPFGVPQSGAQPAPFGFTGELHHEGLVYLRARWYDPGEGTFTSEDPFAGFERMPYSLHPYQYGYSNPLMYVDPTGEQGWENPPDPLICMVNPDAPGCAWVPWAWDWSGVEQQVNEDLDELQNTLDIAGLAPGPLEPLGMTADASNCIISLLRGDWERTGWSATTFIPGIGLFIGGARQGVRYSDSIIEYADEGIRHYPGRSVPPIEKTIDMALNPDLYIQAVIEKYGINLRGSGQDIIVVYNPDLVSAGRSTQVNPNIIRSWTFCNG